MVSAISTDQTPASTTEPVAYTWFKMPDLNRATHRRLGQSGAGWTFETICRLVHLVSRHGRPQAKKAAKELGRLSVGLQAIAGEAGISVAKVRRDLVELVDLGLVAVSRRNVTFKVDPANGKIVENRTGRSMPVVVFVTIGTEHLRTKAGQDRPVMNPATVAGPPTQDRVHPGGAIQRELKTKRVPDGQADGVGRPQPQEEGGHSAAKAGQEGTVVRVDDPHDGLPVPVGRISRPAGKAPPAPRRTNPYQEEQRQPQVWVGPEEQARKAMQARLAAVRAERDRRDAEAKTTAQEAPQEVPAADPETDLRRAVESLPPAKRERCRRLGREAKTAADQAAAEAAMLLEIVRQRTGRDAASDQAARDAKAETCRDLYHREKAAQKAVMA